MINFIIKNNKGYTTIETVVALAIFLAVLIPLSQLLARLIYSEKTRDLIVAMQLARQEMEETINTQNYVDNQKLAMMNNKKWMINCSVKIRDELVELHAQVFKSGNVKPVTELKTLRVIW
jgi:type II secretory pathway pseudopilin PulG